MKNSEVLLDNSFEKEIFYTKKKSYNKGDVVVININNTLYSGTVLDVDIDINTKNYVVRKVDENDIKIIEENNKAAYSTVKEANKIKDRLNLDMNFIDAYYTFDRKQLFLLFIAENRVDFRTLAKKLADKYKTRIELRQIGVRDKAKKIGGIGPCGLFLCCRTFLTDFNSVSISMAKNQFLALNPTKINGLCGRLLCCLNYENETYKLLKEKAPKVGSFIDTSKGKGKVISIDIFKQSCTVELKNQNNIVVNYGKENESVK